jgi:hypothetical protein
MALETPQELETTPAASEERMATTKAIINALHDLPVEDDATNDTSATTDKKASPVHQEAETTPTKKRISPTAHPDECPEPKKVVQSPSDTRKDTGNCFWESPFSPSRSSTHEEHLLFAAKYSPRRPPRSPKHSPLPATVRRSNTTRVLQYHSESTEAFARFPCHLSQFSTTASYSLWYQ